MTNLVVTSKVEQPVEAKSNMKIDQAAVVDGEQSQGEVLTYIEPKAESRMMRKFDLMAIGPLGLMYMMAILDRSNLGNANIAGMPQELGLVGNQFGTATTLLYATYVPLEFPISLLVKRIGPKYLISISALCWGCTTVGMAFITNYKQLYACRILIGFFEAGLIPSCYVYIGLIYKQSERGKRMCLFYAFSALSSAFGGLLAYGLTQIHDGPNGFSGWRWLFAVEGAMTLILAPLFFWAFPRQPTTAWFLTAREKEMMRMRYEADAHWGHDDRWTGRDMVKIVRDPKFYAFCIYQFSADMTLYGFTTFLPGIVTGLGYSSVEANLMTVPIYLSALVFFLVAAIHSDRTRLRGPHLLLCTTLLITGLVLLVAVSNVSVMYFACFIVALGIYPATSLSMIWLQDNVARYYKRSGMVGASLTLANTAGVIVGQVFTDDTAPRYTKGLATCLGFACLASGLVASLIVGMAWTNRKRERKLHEAVDAGEPIAPRPEDGDYDVHFRYSL